MTKSSHSSEYLEKGVCLSFNCSQQEDKQWKIQDFLLKNICFLKDLLKILKNFNIS